MNVDRTSRRGFLGQGIGALAAIGGFAQTAFGIEPFTRTGKPTMKLSLAAYSMRDSLTAKPPATPTMDLDGFIDFCAKLGLDGAELTSYYFPETITADYLVGLKRRAHLAGLSVSGGAIGNDYCQADDAKREADVKKTIEWIHRYAILGAPAIRVFAGSISKGETAEQAIARCAATLERVCEEAGKKGIFLALENHGGITATADSMLKIVHAVKSPWLGVNLDSGNFHVEDPYAELAKIAPYAVNAQVKASISRGSQHEPADFSRIVGILTDSGYTGWLALEYEDKEDPYQAIPRLVDQLRRIVNA